MGYQTFSLYRKAGVGS